ncbi:MAG: DivIVA domain-containing protein [Acidimicrobiales bacterium]
MAYEVDPELPGAFDPDGIAQRDFAVVRRGFDPAAVRAFLAAVADEQAELRRRGHGAELQVADLLGRLDDAEALREEADARAAVLERELADVRAEDALRAAADEAELARHHDALEAARREVAALERRLASQDAGVPEALAALVADALPAADAASVGEETARCWRLRTRPPRPSAPGRSPTGAVEAAARELAQRVVLDAEAEAAAVLEAAHREATEVVAEAVAEAQTQAEQGAAAAEALVADAPGGAERCSRS